MIYVSIFFRIAVGPEKVCIVIDITFPIFANSHTLQEASNSCCALLVIALNEPFSNVLHFNNTRL